MSELWTKPTGASSALWAKPSAVLDSQSHNPSATPLSEAQTRVRHPGRRFA